MTVDATKVDAIKVERRGLMFVLSSPSGAGKTTLAERLLKGDSRIRLSVSATTRKPRPGEIDGKDYFFVSEEKFLRMRDNGEFLEWANVFGNFYATPLEQPEHTRRQRDGDCGPGCKDAVYA